MHNRKIELKIDHFQILEDVPSASGVVKYGDGFYAVGDDSPYLFQLDSEFKLISKRLIYSTEKLEGITLPKFFKPDFEVLNCLPALNLIRSIEFQLSTEPAFLPNACYVFALPSSL